MMRQCTKKEKDMEKLPKDPTTKWGGTWWSLGHRCSYLGQRGLLRGHLSLELSWLMPPQEAHGPLHHCASLGSCSHPHSSTLGPLPHIHTVASIKGESSHGSETLSLLNQRAHLHHFHGKPVLCLHGYCLGKEKSGPRGTQSAPATDTD